MGMMFDLRFERTVGIYSAKGLGERGRLGSPPERAGKSVMGAQMVHSNNKKLPWLEQKEPGGQGEKKPTLCMS